MVNCRPASQWLEFHTSSEKRRTKAGFPISCCFILFSKSRNDIIGLGFRVFILPTSTFFQRLHPLLNPGSGHGGPFLETFCTLNHGWVFHIVFPLNFPQKSRCSPSPTCLDFLSRGFSQDRVPSNTGLYPVLDLCAAPVGCHFNQQW